MLPPKDLEVIRDPPADNIRLDRPALLALDTAAVQRLRYVRQVGHAFLVYPGATHTRFEHALGAYHLTRRALASLEERGELDRVPEAECLAVRLAALLHDIGHYPFSHALEEAGFPSHEQLGVAKLSQGELGEVLAAAPAIVNLFGEIPYAEMQSLIDDPPGKRNWWTAEYLTGFPDDAIDRYCDYSLRMPRSFTQSLAVAWGHAVEANVHATPLQRGAAWVVHPFCVWEGAERDAEHIAWGREGREALADYKTGATYLNFVGDEGADRVVAGVGASYDRLAAIKARYDPDNVFRGNQNIPPARAPA